MTPKPQPWIEDDHPAPSAEQWARERAQVKAQLAKRSRRIWSKGSVSQCPKCAKKSFEGRDDLSLQLPSRGHVVIFRHLQGAKCRHCGYQVLEPADQHDVEEEVGASFHSDYQAKVSRIGSGTLGTYWPKDVQRVTISAGRRPHPRHRPRHGRRQVQQAVRIMASAHLSAPIAQAAACPQPFSRLDYM